METGGIKGHEQTPGGLQDQWFTPSLMYPNLLAFRSFASQPLAYLVTPFSTPDAAPTAYSAINITQFQHPFVSHQANSYDVLDQSVENATGSSQRSSLGVSSSDSRFLENWEAGSSSDNKK